MSYISISPSQSKTLNELSVIVHQWAIQKGWWGTPRNKGELIALMHSELSEALEALRTKPKVKCKHCEMKDATYRGLDLEQGHIWICQACNREHAGPNPSDVKAMDDKVPELTGEAAELADCVIRIFDYCGAYGIDLGEAIRIKHQFNIGRPEKHGKTF